MLASATSMTQRYAKLCLVRHDGPAEVFVIFRAIRHAREGNGGRAIPEIQLRKPRNRDELTRGIALSVEGRIELTGLTTS